MMEEKYEYSTKLRNKEIKFRKWKVKDKKKFLSAGDDKYLIKEALVYDCLEDKTIALSEDEYKYILTKIRETSLEDKVHYTFQCGKCNEVYDYDADLNAIMVGVFEPYGDITIKNHIFTMGSLKNRAFYEAATTVANTPDEKFLIDFILHIDAYNDNDGYTFQQYNEIINELDADVFEKVINAWEKMRFKLDNVYEVQCPHCNATEYFEFDDLPGFFPESWDNQ